MSSGLEKYAKELERAVKNNEITPEEAEKLYLEAKANLAEKNEKEVDEQLSKAYKSLKEHGKKAGLYALEGARKIYENHVKGFNVLSFVFFIFLLFFIYVSEFLQNGLSYSFTRARLSYVIFFLIFVNLFMKPTDEEKKSSFTFAVINLFLPVFFSYVYNLSKTSSFISLTGIVYVFYGMFLPTVLWWFYVYRREEVLPKFLVKFSNVAVPIVILLLVFSSLSPALANINKVQSKDTGFDTGKFASDFKSNLVNGLKNLLFLGEDKKSCSGFDCISDWFNNNFVEPFKYDPTKVDKIENLDLGIYIRDLDIPQEINIEYFSPYGFVSPPIKFYLESPIDSKVWTSLCSNSEFGNICDEKVFMSCFVEDSNTEVIPQNDTFYNIVASKKKLIVCNFIKPFGTGNKKVTVNVTYPFVTNTFKFLRLVNGNYLRENPEDNVLSELESKNDNLIVSNGGPVIVGSSEDKYIIISGEKVVVPIVFSFKPTQDFKLEKIEKIKLTLPSSFKLAKSNLCDFEESSEKNNRIQTTYYMSDKGLEYLNNALKTNNNVGFSCNVEISRDGLNFEDQSYIERSINLVTKYVVSESKTGNILFTGTLKEFPYSPDSIVSKMLPSQRFYSNTGCANEFFDDFPFDVLNSVPKVDPLNGKGYFTSCYGRRNVKPYNHYALDIGTAQLKDPSPVVYAATPGRVVFAGENSQGYGNLVMIENVLKSTDEYDYVLKTMYGHLRKITTRYGATVNAGTPIGYVGTTGNSNGNHLHFEVRIIKRKKDSGKYVDETVQNINPIYIFKNINTLRNENAEKYHNALKCYADTALLKPGTLICKSGLNE